MADNIDVSAGAGKTIAADEIGAVLFQRVKLIHGADGTNDGDVSTDNRLPTMSNTSATAVVGSAGGSVSGQYVGISDLGITLVAPEANHNTKVYAFSIITTAQVQIVPKFTNGAGGATELWRVALQAPTQGISGVSQSIQPPGYLFATGINTTLALRLDSASLVHYSISYFKESA